jgi:uncharacterized membrane protein YedE/YeeE
MDQSETALRAVIPVAKYFNLTNTKPPPTCSLGWFHNYDANIMGGVLLGVGMALTGACPGTVLPQIVTGVRSGLFVGIGGILGGMWFAMNITHVMDGDFEVCFQSFKWTEL